VQATHRDETVAVTGLPIALVNTVTGRRHVRRLSHNEGESAEYVLSTASFPNLAPGTYRVELMSAPESPTDPPAAPSDGSNPSLLTSRWRRALIGVGIRWRWPSPYRKTKSNDAATFD